MTHGAPDWTTSAPSTSTFVSMDTNELAVRLGFVGTEERNGNVLWFTDFSTGLGDVIPRLLNPVTVVYPVLIPTYQRHLILRSEHGTGKNNACFLEKGCPRLKSGKYAIEGGMAYSGNGTYYYYDITDYSTARKYQYDIRYTFTSGVLSYLNSGGSYTTFATIPTQLGALIRFWVGKLIVNLETHEYVSFICQGVVYDLVGIACYNVALVGIAYTNLLIGYTAPAATTCDAYYSHMILTRER